MAEPDVTLTDYAVTLLCAVFSWLIYRKDGPRSALRNWFVLLFTALSLASFTGGTAHGFFPDENSFGHKIFWPASLLSLGVTALAAWGIAATLLFTPKIARLISIAAGIAFFVYSLVIIFVTQTFLAAIIDYLPAVIALLFAFLRRYWSTRDSQMLLGITGLLLTFVAAAIQQAQIPVHRVYFDHNALYHLIQAVALFMIFSCARSLIKCPLILALQTERRRT